MLTSNSIGFWTVSPVLGFKTFISKPSEELVVAKLIWISKTCSDRWGIIQEIFSYKPLLSSS